MKNLYNFKRFKKNNQITLVFYKIKIKLILKKKHR